MVSLAFTRNWIQVQVYTVLEQKPERYDAHRSWLTAVSLQFKKVTDDLLRTYYPIEIDRNMTREEKIPYMVEWWEKSHRALVSQNLTREGNIIVTGMGEVEN